jgi:hypothetical protein
MFVEPCQHTLLHVDSVRVLLNAVALTWVDYQFSLDARVLYSSVKHICLVQRHRVKLAVRISCHNPRLRGVLVIKETSYDQRISGRAL